jgi:RimJ/RimL family protein N-acetyltransferase
VKRAPYRIETGRLTLRCYEPADAPWFKEMVDESEASLNGHLWWYTGKSLDETVERLQEFRSKFDTGEAYAYAVHEGDRPVGGGVLHTRRGAFGLEVGYWVRTSALGRGIATETAAALVHVAFVVCEADRVEFHISTGNDASIAVVRRLGIQREAVLRRRWANRDGEPHFDQEIYTQFRADYDPAIVPPLRAFDALGRQLL